ncbi:hypothetical protein ARC78_15010 [Stenotrophomonas pictorum JCM 9942]|uniref:Uncharacterized protein n=1 Tax=Stenotrophomonas pictorum JCM 9942 TaxID=1236960 RepID=A0A0R0A1T6_9GAMM|nr:hypothetical protein [Stenotrophomonas pictorum]KRG39125.1 hypothetical protein ARC78_15010 [Stenotrophomonas pictorum JCM 9942]
MSNTEPTGLPDIQAPVLPAAAQEAGLDAYDQALDQLWKLAGGNDSPVYKLFLGFRDSFAASVAAAQEAAAWQVGDDFYTSESLAIEGIQQWGPSGSIAIPLYAAPVAAAQEAVAWFTDDHLTDRSATTFDPVVAERWRNKGWPVTKLYAAPVAAAPVVDPSRLGAAMKAFDDAGGHAVSYAPAWMRKALEAASTPAAQEAVAYLDIGAGGYLDLGSNLPEVQLLALPKGRHALGIIGTYGIDGYAAAPVAAATAVDVATLRALADRWATDRSYTGSPVDDIRALIEKPTMSTPAAPGIDLEQFRERIKAAIVRITTGQAPMRVPADQADPDIVLADILSLIDANPKGDDVEAD